MVGFCYDYSFEANPVEFEFGPPFKFLSFFLYWAHLGSFAYYDASGFESSALLEEDYYS